MSTSTAIDAGEVKAALLSMSEEVCRILLPAGKRSGKQWRCGNLRGDAGNSLSVSLVSGVWEDFATGEKGGNLLELWLQVKGQSFSEALHDAANFGARTETKSTFICQHGYVLGRQAWPEFRIGSTTELSTLAQLRGIPLEGLEIASTRGLLRFAEWRGQQCWLVTDSKRDNAQVRRLDGKPFIVGDQSRKAITLPGSSASAPIGLEEAKKFSTVALVEGGPDLLAAHACMWAEERQDIAAVTVLGASHRPSRDVWTPLTGKRVRIYVHADDSGLTAGTAWAKAIFAAGAAKIDGFRFTGLQKIDGARVEDLNDLLALHPDDFEARRDVWEVLP